ncbi:hypothetical protein QJQ45_005186 [Haematococcus lacustris]|nr:hypothetical protein QJQ45_005186 [Haematococcus lacustris]
MPSLQKYCSEKGLVLENADNPSYSATLVLCYLTHSNTRLWQLRCSPDRTHPPSEELQLLESQELDIPALKRLSAALELGFEEAQAVSREHGAVNRLVDYAIYLRTYKGLRCQLSQNAKRHVPGRLINAGREEEANPMRDNWKEMMARRWLDRDTHGCFNLQRIGQSMQRPLELCSYEGLEALPPVGKGYKRVNDRLPKGRQRLHRAAEYRRGIDGRARNNA